MAVCLRENMIENKATAVGTKKLTQNDFFKRLLGHLKRDTCFMYRERLVSEGAPHNALRSTDEVTKAWINGDIAMTDLFILESIQICSFATVEMVCEYLNYKKLISPELMLPPMEYDGVKRRVVSLCSNGLLCGKRFIHDDSNVRVIIYSCTHNAFELLKNQMQRFIYENKMLMTMNDMEILGRTASVYNALAVIGQRGIRCEEFQGPGEDSALKKYENKPPYLSSKIRISARTKAGEQKKATVAFEPFYFNFDTRFYREQDVRNNLESRLTKMLKWAIATENKLNEKPVVALTCENIDGIRKAAQFVHEHAAGLEVYCCYTSESVLHEFKGSGNEYKSFLRMVYGEDGNTNAEQCSLFH